MVFREELAVGRDTGARGDGVKTKNGCEDVIFGPPGGVVNNYFRKTPQIWATIFCHPPQKKVGLHFGWTPQTRADACRGWVVRLRGWVIDVSFDRIFVVILCMTISYELICK